MEVFAGEADMDKRKRMLNAMNQREVDHVPAGFWYHFTGGDAAGEKCVRAHLNFFREIDGDFIKVMSDGYFQYPLAVKIEKASDWYNLKPLGKDHPFIQEQVWRAKRIKEEAGDECCVFYNVFAPFSSIRFGAGDDLVMRHIREDKAAVMYALDVIAKDNAALSELLLTEAKNEGVYYCVQGGELDRFGYSEYREMITPSDLFVLKHANRYSENNMLHMCGWAGIKNRLEIWRDYPAKTVNWAVHVEEVSLEQGREYFGGPSVLGGFQNVRPGILYYGTKAQIKKRTKDIITAFGRKGLILGGDCSFPGEICHEHFHWVIEASREM
jgi:uroporphyrinogen decarboxylase